MPNLCADAHLGNCSNVDGRPLARCNDNIFNIGNVLNQGDTADKLLFAGLLRARYRLATLRDQVIDREGDR